jgi:hypothetical protein
MTASTNSPRALVDTNIVVYAYDLDEPLKHDRARELLKTLSDDHRLGRGGKGSEADNMNRLMIHLCNADPFIRCRLLTSLSDALLAPPDSGRESQWIQSANSRPGGKPLY